MVYILFIGDEFVFIWVDYLVVFQCGIVEDFQVIVGRVGKLDYFVYLVIGQFGGGGFFVWCVF